MKKIFSLLFILAGVFACSLTVSATNPAREYTQNLGDFETLQTGNLAAAASAGESDFFVRRSSGGVAKVVEGGANPMGSGKAIQIGEHTQNLATADSSASFVNSKLLDMAEGADYTKLRVMEFDMYLEGGEPRLTTSGTTMDIRLGGTLVAHIRSNRKDFSLVQYQVDSRGQILGYDIITNLMLGQKHHIKVVYEVLDPAETGNTAQLARFVAVFVNGTAYDSNAITRMLPSSGSTYQNYLYDSLADGTRVNYGITTNKLQNLSPLYFNVPQKVGATLFVDNLRYYGTGAVGYVCDGFSAYAGDGDSFTYNTLLENEFRLKFTGKNETFNLYAALYDAAGNLLKIVKTEDFTFTEEAVKNYTWELSEEPGTYKIKLFYWSDMDTLMPVHDAAETTLTVTADKAKAVEKIYHKLKNSVSNSTATPSASVLSAWDEATGSFTDIDYADRTRASWKPYEHLSRLKTLAAICYSERNSNYRDPELMEIIAEGLTFWYNNMDTIESDNWWWNEDAEPRILAEILFFRPEGLSDSVKTGLSDYALKWSYIKLDKPLGTLRPYQASNEEFFEQLVSSIKLAYLTSDDYAEVYDEFVRFFDAANYELTLKTYAYQAEGVNSYDTMSLKADYSYQQHGNNALWASYGVTFIQEMIKYFNVFEGTELKLSDEAAVELSHVLLDGFRWAKYKGYLLPILTGRGFGAYSSNLYSNTADTTLYKYLIDNFSHVVDNDALQAEYDRMVNGYSDGSFSGNRHFWTSDYTVHNREDYHFSVRSASSRTRTSESANSQGKALRYQGDGMTMIMQDGSEYNSLGGVYDFHKMPGTTTDQSHHVMPPTDKVENGATSFVGAVSDGNYGMHLFTYNRDGVEAKKSWFMFEDEVVALGAGITSTSEGEIYTSINQTTLKGTVYAKVNGVVKTISEGDADFDKVHWVLQDGVGYKFFTPQDGVQIFNQEVVGDWSVTDWNYPEGTTAVQDVFLLGQSHGVAPTDATYAYMIIPGSTYASMATYETANPITILSNTENLQALWHSGLTMLQAAFFEAGSVTLPNGVTVSVSAPCALMITFDGNHYEIAISNPDHKALHCNVTLSGAISKTVSFNKGLDEKLNNAGITYFYNSKNPPVVDNNGPTIRASFANGAMLPTAGTLTFTFSENMDASTISNKTVSFLEEDVYTEVEGDYIARHCDMTYNDTTNTLTVVFKEGDIAPGMTYAIAFTDDISADSDYDTIQAQTFTFKTAGNGYYINDNFSRYDTGQMDSTDRPWTAPSGTYVARSVQDTADGRALVLSTQDSATTNRGSSTYMSAFIPRDLPQMSEATTAATAITGETEIDFMFTGDTAAIIDLGSAFVIQKDADADTMGLYCVTSGGPSGGAYKTSGIKRLATVQPNVRYTLRYVASYYSNGNGYNEGSHVKTLLDATLTMAGGTATDLVTEAVSLSTHSGVKTSYTYYSRTQNHRLVGIGRNNSTTPVKLYVYSFKHKPFIAN